MSHTTLHAAATGYQTKEVSFRSWGIDLKGLLFVPEDFDESKQYPTVVFSGPLTQIKEQMGSDYGKAFARRGYILLSFDHYGHGESAGEPRNHENSEIKKESVRDAISFLRTLPYVDRDRLYGLGGCAAGGYMPLVAVTDKRLKGVATTSGYTNSSALYFAAKSKEEMVEILTKANEARQRAYETGEAEYIDVISPYGGEIADYYMTARAGTERFPQYSHLSVANAVEFTSMQDPTLYAKYLYMPYIGVVGSEAYSKAMTKSMYDAALEPKAYVEIEGATHITLYDNEAHIAEAVEAIDKFFTQNVQ